MPLMSWQLWLARDLVIENTLPWQSEAYQFNPWTCGPINVFGFS